ncbi:hypothetical protein [Streptomyces sp. NPDC089919]|uniref:hypothetical protein n=1 Tax=Streptomyces sp. NPDC089919 TaxID=3155188 RepID=UPI00341C7B23
MISEPELDDFEPPAGERPLRYEDPADPPPAARPRRPRGPWVWALAGAVLASAGWAGALYATGYGRDEGKPPLAYRVPGDLCEEVKAAALLRAFGRPMDGTNHFDVQHPAVDWYSCVGQAQGKETKGWFAAYEYDFTLAVHKETDPRPELDADADRSFWGAGEPMKREEVPGLGEYAVMLTGSDEGNPELRVVDGGAVFTVRASVNWSWNGDKEPQEEHPADSIDTTALQAAMIEDLRSLMAGLRKK